MQKDTKMAQSIPHWIIKPKNSSGVIISSRARIARNIKNFQYLYKLKNKFANQLLETINLTLKQIFKSNKKLIFINLSEQSQQFKQLLKERFLITDYLLKGENKEIIIDEKEYINIMINEEENHIRIQAIYPGINIKKAYQTVLDLESKLEEKLEFDFHPEFGYLTSCPTNVGTGLRISVMMHLPGLVLMNKITQLIDNLVESGLTIRGFFGEGSKYLGNIYQISNQISLGVSEQEIIEKVENIVLEIEKLELKARKNCLKIKSIKEKILKSYILIKNSTSLKYIDAMNLLSLLKLGIYLNIIKIDDDKEIDKLLIIIQPAHIACYNKKNNLNEINITLENKLRVDLIKDVLKRGNICLNNSQPALNRL